MKRLKRKIKYLKYSFMWWLLARITYWWITKGMDQWEKFKFDTEYATVYITFSRYNDYPDSFDLIDKNGNLIKQSG